MNSTIVKRKRIDEDMNNAICTAYIKRSNTGIEELAERVELIKSVICFFIENKYRRAGISFYPRLSMPISRVYE